MPLGLELAETICRKTNVSFDIFHNPSGGNADLIQGAVNSEFSLKTIAKAAIEIHKGLPYSNSIDDFINLRKDDAAIVKLGKSAITQTILEREANSRIFVHNEDQLDISGDLAKSWKVQLIKLLCRLAASDAFKKITFITFNYDRCLEHFLLHAIRSLHGLSMEKSAEIVKNINIYHPYGVTGQLPQLAGTTPFGYSDSGIHRALSSQIKTYAEEVTITNELRAIHTRLERAQTIIFLGFAFHQQNIDLMTVCGLLPRAHPSKTKNIFATATGISQPGAEVVKRRISRMFLEEDQQAMFNRAVVRTDLNCSQFFNEFGATLSEL